MNQPPQQLQDILTRIASHTPSRLTPPPVPPRCVRCQDTHLIEMTGGTYTTPNGHTITATPEQPIYRQCECRNRTHKTPPAAREF